MISLIASLVLLGGLVTSQPQPVDCKNDQGGGKPYVPYRLILKPRDGGPLSDSALRSLLKELLGPKFKKSKLDEFTIRRVGSTGAVVVDSPLINVDDPEALARWKSDARLEYVERDPYIRLHGSRNPNDHHFGKLWGLQDIAAPAAWLHAKGDKNIVAAIVDTGIDISHPDLAQQIWSSSVPIGGCPSGSTGYDAIADVCTVVVHDDHATLMAGTIGAEGDNNKNGDDKTGIVGVNWHVGLLSAGFIGDGQGCASTAANALKFVLLAKQAGVNVRVANLSWGWGIDAQSIRDELQNLSKEGIVLVASAGNEQQDIDHTKVYPASYAFDTLIAVAATKSDESFAAAFSNFGPASTHIAAPGEYILTTSGESAGGLASNEWGTSYAAAYVTGAVALLASRCPKLTGKELKDLLLSTADQRDQLRPFVQEGRFLNVGRAMAECVCRAK